MTQNAMISLVGLDKAEVLAALYNASKPQGMGFLHYDAKPMTREEAEKHLEKDTRFDYLNGRVMKINLGNDELDPFLYDRDNGQNAALKAITELRVFNDTNTKSIQETHKTSTVNAALNVQDNILTKSSVDDCVGMKTLNLGLSDVAEKLSPAIDKVLNDQ